MAGERIRYELFGFVGVALAALVSENLVRAQGSSNVDQVLATCPSASEIAAIDSDFALSFESDLHAYRCMH
jgi:hypothetical protein